LTRRRLLPQTTTVASSGQAGSGRILPDAARAAGREEASMSLGVRARALPSCALLLAAVLAPAPAGAVVIFSQTQTGADLAANPAVTFLETGAITGTALDFTSGAAGADRFLLAWSLLPAGSRGDLTVTITIDYAPLTADNDFIFGLHDGASVAGWERSDNSAGSWFTRQGSVSGTAAPADFVFVQGGLGAVEPFTLVYTVSSGGNSTGFTITEGPASAPFTFASNPLDAGRPLVFFMARNNTDEDYRINSVSITIDAAQAVTVLSRGPGGVPADGASEAPAVSADGRYVVFASRATNLAAECATGERHVYRVDRLTGQTRCVSRTAAGPPGDGPSGDPVVSGDGRYVAYPTRAASLAPACASSVDQIVRTDAVTGETVCVSQGSAGPGDAPSRQPTISEDGTLVAFVTAAINLDPACATGIDQIQLRDVAAGTTRCLTVDAAGRAGTGPSLDPALSGDGTTLVFASRATNLVFAAAVAAGAPVARAVAGGPRTETEPLAQVIRRGTAVGAAATELMSQGAGGALANGDSRQPSVSRDGRTVAFASTATNLVPECATGASQVLVASGAGMQCASRNEEGAAGDGPSDQPALSGDGLVVVWVSLARNLTRGASPSQDVAQALRRSLATQNAVVDLLSQTGGTPGNGSSRRPALDLTGAVTVLQTSATNLDAADTNGLDDVLLVAIPVTAPAPADRVFITAPANGTALPLTTSTPLAITWTARAGATQYALEFTGADRVFGNPNGTGPDGQNGFGGAGGAVVVPATRFDVTLEPGFPPGLYQVRVVGLTAAFELLGRFSDALTLALGAVPPGTGRVAITTPASGSVLTRGTPVTFVWEALAGAGSYFFEFTGPGGQFANPNGTTPDPVNTAGGGLIVPTTGFTVPVPALPAGTYQVRVIGRTPAGAFVGTFSDAVTLTIQ
jgi:Tol biopolymer transport system component